MSAVLLENVSSFSKSVRKCQHFFKINEFLMRNCQQTFSEVSANFFEMSALFQNQQIFLIIGVSNFLKINVFLKKKMSAVFLKCQQKIFLKFQQTSPSLIFQTLSTTLSACPLGLTLPAPASGRGDI